MTGGASRPMNPIAMHIPTPRASSRKCRIRTTRTLHDYDRPRYSRSVLPWMLTAMLYSVLPTGAAQMSERDILSKLYVDTTGESWRETDGWGSDRDVCTWHGISCDPKTNKVQKIDLSRNNLNGQLPSELWQLPSLTNANFRSNLLTSASFEGLLTLNDKTDPRSPLEEIVLSDNHLTNINGIGYSQATLETLNVNKNQIDGTLPDELFTCLFLNSIYIAFNQFQGPLPTHIGRLNKLKELYAFDNRFSGPIPSELGLLDQMQVLGLGNNMFTGVLPTEIEQMVNLRDVSIHHVVDVESAQRRNGLTGPLPTFGDMPYLSLLFLDGNSLTGTIPSDFLRHNQQLNQPVSIGLTNNLLTGVVPKTLERFDALSIDLIGNQMTEIPKQLCEKGGWMGGLVEEFKCDAILCPIGTYNVLGRAFGTKNPCMPCEEEQAFLGNTKCEAGSSPEDQWKLLGVFYQNLEGEKWTIRDGWRIFDNLVAGGTIDDIENLGINICDDWFGIVCNEDGNVTDMVLPQNELFGTIPEEVFSLQSLEVFDLSNNNVELRNFNGIAKASELTSLILSNVKVGGIEGIGKLTSLEHLFLDGLNFKGTLPIELFDLTNLKTLHLQHGDFTGTLPTEIGRLTNLEKLNFYGNGLIGTIPTEIGSLTLLRSFDLSENQFTGTIPSEIRSMSELEVFAIHQNDEDTNLDGPLPSFDSFPNLKEVNLDSNNISGTIPAAFLGRVADKTSEITISLAHNQLDGAIPSSLNTFNKLNIKLEGNMITSIPDILCNKPMWMQGEVGKLSEETKCNAILCPPGTWNQFGKETDAGPCISCDAEPSSSSDTWPTWYGRVVCGNTIPSREKEILDNLFTMTGGRYWTAVHDNWLRPGVPICQREGVFCGDPNADEGVLELRMNQFGLRGTIPSDIWELSGARQLAFTLNDVDVSFDGIEQAEALVVLKLSKCHLRSLEGLGKASPKLRELHVAENQFNGTIPEDIFELDQVKLIFLNNNHFSGTVPLDLAKMTSLERLELFNNRLTGPLPSELGLLSDLSILEVHQNQLSGGIPLEIQTSTTLSKLDISQQSGRQFEGPFPAFDKASSLVYVDASGNSFSGNLPPNLLFTTDPDEEIVVNLSQNLFEGSVPVEWSRLANLQLDLSGNRITSLPESLCQMNGWNKGKVGLFGTCDAILCPPGTQLLFGRQMEATAACSPCEAGLLSAPFFGATECLDPRIAKEEELLRNFYESADGTNWLIQTNWLSSKPVCSWYGLTCDENEHIIGVNLPNNLVVSAGASMEKVSEILQLEDLAVLDLKGNAVQLDFSKIPKESSLSFLRLSDTGITSLDGISQASSLKALHVTNNQIASIPDEIYTMTNLESLFLSYNDMTGTISRFISQMAALREFYAFGNRLTGSIPTEVGLLSNLSDFVVADNYLSGTLPDELSFLPSLEQLSVYDQRGKELITGPIPSFSGARRVWNFDASNNDLTGPIPDNFMINSIYKNETITVYLKNNDITGTIPSQFENFEYLNLDLADNKILEIPPELCEIGGWMLGKAKFVGNCSAVLCPSGYFNQFGHASEGNPCLPCTLLQDDPYLGHTRCENFTSERETLNKIYEETGGEFWTNSTNWKSDAPICLWEGVLCEGGDLQDSEGITALLLPANGLSGTLPSETWTLPSLRTLSVQENPKLVVGFEGLEKGADTLEVLELSNTKMSSLDGISAASKLRTLHIVNNGIKGTFPQELFALSRTLESLHISDNLFYGPLPTRIGELSMLQEFFAFRNDFLSTIPSEIGLLTGLQTLYLSENLLYGQIPEELSKMPVLEFLSIYRDEKSGPRLTGTLPAFERLPLLMSIDLHGNDIAGTIPENIVSASLFARTIRLSSNLLTGVVPQTLEQIPNITLELEDNLIDGFPLTFCNNEGINGGKLARLGCHALLCPPGSFSPFGRSVNSSVTCTECPQLSSTKYYGSISCGQLNQREILVKLFYDLDGQNWYRSDFWGTTADICDWYGIGCNEGHIVMINLGGNNLRGIPSPDLFDLPELRVLWLYSNPLEFSFENIGNAKKLEDLRLDMTKLHTLRGIGAAKSLISLDASFTALRGSFPGDEILNLVNLRFLKLNDNALTGSLPKSFGTLPFLSVMRVDSNSLSGNFPAFDNMPFLQYIDASDNSLGGPISRKLFDRLDWEVEPTLRLSRNELTGVVPQEFDRFKRMNLNLVGNEILGLPVVLCNNNEWNGGDVGVFGCEAILCRPGTWNPLGRSKPGSECRPCAAATYWGQTSCLTSSGSSAHFGLEIVAITTISFLLIIGI